MTRQPFWDEIAYRVGTRDCRGRCVEMAIGHWCDRCLLAVAVVDRIEYERDLATMEQRVKAIIDRINEVMPDEAAVKPDTIN